MDKLKIEKLVEKNGIRSQSIEVQKKCEGLIQAISKCMHPKTMLPIQERECLMEKMADIMICLEQLQIMYYIDDEELYAIKQKKENRLIEREGLKK